MGLGRRGRERGGPSEAGGAQGEEPAMVCKVLGAPRAAVPQSRFHGDGSRRPPGPDPFYEMQRQFLAAGKGLWLRGKLRGGDPQRRHLQSRKLGRTGVRDLGDGGEAGTGAAPPRFLSPPALASTQHFPPWDPGYPRTRSQGRWGTPPPTPSKPCRTRSSTPCPPPQPRLASLL